MKKNKIRLMLGSIMLGLASITSAQLPSGSPAQLNAALIQLFGDIKAFSSSANMRVLDNHENEIMEAPMKFALFDGKVRTELDMSKVKSAQLSPEAVTNLKNLGLGHMISILQPKSKNTLVVYPFLKAYTIVPITEGNTLNADGDYTVSKTSLGIDTIEAQQCEKQAVTIANSSGQKWQALVWYAPGLKQFPLQIKLTDQGTSIVMAFSDVKFQAPDAKLFDAPQGFAKHDNIQSLMQSAVMKKLGGGL